MSFHRKLIAGDLHAPSIFEVENGGTAAIASGDLVKVTGFNQVTQKLIVRLASDSGVVTTSDENLVFGISRSNMPGISTLGRMDALGVTENLNITLTEHAGGTEPRPLTVGNKVYIPVTGANVGTVTSGDVNFAVEFGVILETITTTSANVMIFGLLAGGGSGSGETNKTRINFDTSNTDPLLGPVWVVADGERTSTFNYTIGTNDYIAQWYELRPEDPLDPASTKIARVIDLDWSPRGTPENNPRIIVNLRGDLPTFEGYVEIIY